MSPRQSGRKPAVSRADAIEIVRDAVAKDNREPAALQMAVLNLDPLELPWAWVVAVQSAEHPTTSDKRFGLVGVGPYLVDKFTGEAIRTGTGSRLHQIERERGYRAWWDRRGPNSVLELRWPDGQLCPRFVPVGHE